MMAIRVLLDHDVLEENIILVSLLMAETGVHSLAYAFPKVCTSQLFNLQHSSVQSKKTTSFMFQVTLITTAVDPNINELFYVIPGIGNFGDRYYGTAANKS